MAFLLAFAEGESHLNFCMAFLVAFFVGISGGNFMKEFYDGILEGIILSFVAGVSRFYILQKFLVGICLMSFYKGILWHFMIAFCVNILLEFVTGIC